MLQFTVRVNVRVGDRKIIRGGQAFVLRAVFGIGLHVFAKDLSGNGGDHLVGCYGAKPADRVASHRKGPSRTQVGIVEDGECQWVLDADAKVVLPLLDHIIEDGVDVARTHVAPLAAIGHTHHVVVSGVDIEAMTGERPGANVKHDR